MIYLKATDKETFDQAIADAGWSYEEVVDPENDEATTTIVDQYTTTHSLDIIGLIHMPTGNMLTHEGHDGGPEQEYPEMAPIDGWHANLLLHGEELPASLEPFVIEAPSTPHRKFA